MNKNRKAPLNLRVYFTAIVLAEILVSLIVTSVLANLLGAPLNLRVSPSVILLMLLFSTIIGYTVNFFLSRAFFRPITRLGSAMQKVAKGDFSPRINTKSHIREIRELYGDFNIMASELSSTEIIQTDFVSNVSHEFKTPINAIQGYATLLQNEGASSEDKAEYVRKILLNTGRLSDLVGNILLLSKLDNSAMELPSVSYHLDEQIRLAILLLEEKWTVKNIDFDVELDEAAYYGNEKLMAHVFSNLIDNAIKFSPQDGVIRMRLKAPSEGNDEYLRFTIEDYGPGIPEQAMDHIFDRFYQTDSSHKAEGNGLGLSLVKQILTVSGGTVSVRNCTEHTGCEFIVTLHNNH